MSSRTPALAARWKRAELVEDLCDFVRIPSISAQPARAGDVRRAAAWLAARLRRAGLENVTIVTTPRHPIVTAGWRHAPGRPTVLVYGHYDVQPADPVAAWHTPPFAPAVRNGHLYGRGASDDKGQLLCHVFAVEELLRSQGRLPLNVVCLFEGEEEIGSPNLSPFLQKYRQAFAAEAAVVSDTRFLAPGRPAITYALRGGLGLEITVRTLRRDVHSGSFGGAVVNPIQVLAEMLCGMHNRDGRVAVPGFYRRVRMIDDVERAFMTRNGPDDTQIARDAASSAIVGEPGFTLYESTTIRPVLTFNGISGGYQGPGGKGIIPAQASAKISFRLVPDQRPDEIEQSVRKFLARLTPRGATLTVTTQQQSAPVIIDRRHAAIQAAAQAYRSGFGAAPVFLRSGGSIPIVRTFEEILGVPTVLMGFALPDDGMHAPNERFALQQLFQGVETCIHFLKNMSRLSPGELRRRSREPHDHRLPLSRRPG